MKKKITKKEFDIAVAWAESRISHAQACKALNKGTHTTYSTLARALKFKHYGQQ